MNVSSRWWLSSSLVLAGWGSPGLAQGGDLFGEVVRTLESRYFDQEARTTLIPALAETLGPLARETTSLEEERVVIDVLLSQLEISHCALYSKFAHQMMQAELMNFEYATLGLQLRVDQGDYCVDWVYEGGPAAEAGLVRGQVVETLDGLPVERSPLLDWNTDDAAKPDAPLHALQVKTDQRVKLGLRGAEPIELVARKDNGWEAAQRSARIVEHQGLRMGYVHFWFIHVRGPAGLLQQLIEGRFRDCDALLLDLRGRGGSAAEVDNVVMTLERVLPDSMRLVALTDGGTRSAKEVIAYEIRERDLGLVVGEATAGAVIPASFHNVSEEAVLMFPSFTLKRYTALIEGKPVAPDVTVEDDLRSPEDEVLNAGIAAAAAWIQSLR